jgi:hypothetical protein
MLTIPGLGHGQVAFLLVQLATLAIVASAFLMICGVRGRAGQTFLLGLLLAFAASLG